MKPANAALEKEKRRWSMYVCDVTIGNLGSKMSLDINKVSLRPA